MATQASRDSTISGIASESQNGALFAGGRLIGMTAAGGGAAGASGWRQGLAA